MVGSVWEYKNTWKLWQQIEVVSFKVDAQTYGSRSQKESWAFLQVEELNKNYRVGSKILTGKVAFYPMTLSIGLINLIPIMFPKYSNFTPGPVFLRQKPLRRPLVTTTSSAMSARTPHSGWLWELMQVLTEDQKSTNSLLNLKGSVKC